MDGQIDFSPLGLRGKPVIAHASLKAFGRVAGGAPALLNALLDEVSALIMPTHTYKTMITPRVGPALNGLDYTREHHLSVMAEPFHPQLPADKLMGIVPETLRQRPDSFRSSHPILSFAGVRAESFLRAQTLDDPFAPIRLLAEAGGWVVLLGVDNTVNTSIHLAEKLAGRRQFLRWAYAAEGGIVACPGFPGCSAGFEAVSDQIRPYARLIQIGDARVQAMPLGALLPLVVETIRNNSLAYLCDDVLCGRCNVTRARRQGAV
jgi:aminoglycoside 3-N-acetyltransferase